MKNSMTVKARDKKGCLLEVLVRLIKNFSLESVIWIYLNVK